MGWYRSRWLHHCGRFSQTVSGSLFACMHLLYLSLDIPVGLTYPWDSALLEIGWYAPLFPRCCRSSATGSLPVFTSSRSNTSHCSGCRWQIFRHAGFGKQKFIGTSSSHHCYLRGFMVGMPMPSKLGWLMHHQPLWAHKLSLGIMFIVEILLPPSFCGVGSQEPWRRWEHAVSWWVSRRRAISDL